MSTYHSLCECSAKLINRFSRLSKQVLSGQQFENEEDSHVLLDTAVFLESILATSSFRRHLAAAANDLREDALLSLLGKSDMDNYRGPIRRNDILARSIAFDCRNGARQYNCGSCTRGRRRHI